MGVEWKGDERGGEEGELGTLGRNSGLFMLGLTESSFP